MLPAKSFDGVITSASLVLAVVLDHWYTSLVVTVQSVVPPIETVKLQADSDAIFTVTMYFVALSTVRLAACSRVAVLPAVCVANPDKIDQLAPTVQPVAEPKSPLTVKSPPSVQRLALFASYVHLNMPFAANTTPKAEVP